MSVSYVASHSVLLKKYPGLDEHWVQTRIAENPSLLGLGEVELKASEVRQAQGGRLDLLLHDAVAKRRYEVEIQLGATDESHIIRTIEYWDNERKRWPNYEHVAVIVAEEITGRFFNVISLFNGYMPIIAIKLSAIRVGDVVTLVFTKVLDWVVPGTDEEEGDSRPGSRAGWEKRVPAASLAVTDGLLKIVQEVHPKVALNYKQNYIGLAEAGIAGNYLWFQPRKNGRVLTGFKIDRSDDLDRRIEESGLALVDYLTDARAYRLMIGKHDLDENHDLLRELAQLAHDARYGPDAPALGPELPV